MGMVIFLQIPTRIINRLRNYFSQSLNVHNISDVREREDEREVHTAEPLVRGPSHLEVEMLLGS
jgi:hypothetical protein